MPYRFKKTVCSFFKIIDTYRRTEVSGIRMPLFDKVICSHHGSIYIIDDDAIHFYRLIISIQKNNRTIKKGKWSKIFSQHFCTQ